jgi:hypothetical protein
MLLRNWDRESVLRSIPWLRLQNRNAAHIYVRPSGEHSLSLVDDLTIEAVTAMKEHGFHPAVVVETSPGNYQAWVRHEEVLKKETSTAAARALAEKFGGDKGAADWRHFGRLSGLVNRKAKYRDVVTGMFPFVRLIEADGRVYPEAERFVAGIRRELEDRRRERAQLSRRALDRQHGPLKTIDAFRADPRYAGDGNRVDLAWATYALANGASERVVSTVIRSRDLTKKGDERRQAQYVERTISKAARFVEIERGR